MLKFGIAAEAPADVRQQLDQTVAYQILSLPLSLLYAVYLGYPTHD